MPTYPLRYPRCRQNGCPGCAVCRIAKRYHLTHREVDVIALTLAGMSISEVAETLQSGTRTVEELLRRIYEKTGMENQLSLALWAIARLREDSSIPHN